MASLRKHGKVWYYRFTDADGIKREWKGCTDRRATEDLARHAESNVARTKRGLSDPKAERIAVENRRPICEQIAGLIDSMKSKGRDPKHVRSTQTYIERVITLARIERARDLTPSAIDQAVLTLKADGLSARAVNAHITAVKSLSRWLKRDGRIADYTLETVGKLDERSDRRRIRRALTPEQATRVIHAASAGPEAFGLTGPERAMLYDLALGTGFRAEELATLTPERFSLGSDPPTVTVLAGYAKNGTEAVQPIAIALADRLCPWLADKTPGRPVFDGMTHRTAEMLRVDMEAAGIPYETASGVADFHALRAAYVSNLVASGASVKTCQTLARHSTPSLTIGVYAKVSLHDIKGAVENLPDLIAEGAAPEREAMAATGTDGNLPHYFPTGGDVLSRDESLPGVIAQSSDVTCMNEKPLENQGLDASSRIESAAGGSAPRRTRTYNPLIKSQLLYQLS
jgi:integrase